jgi:hypothetical protein
MNFNDLFNFAVAGGSNKEINQQINGLKQWSERQLKALEILTHLRESWRQKYPGKRSPYVFFVRRYELDVDGFLSQVKWCDGFFARELVSDLEEAEQGVPHYIDTRPSHDKRTPVPLGHLHEALTSVCSCCGTSNTYEIGEYRQVADSPDGDAWDLNLMNFCLLCLHVETTHRRMSAYPFLDRLRYPEGECSSQK